MPTRRDLQKLAKLRLREAEHLERKGLYDGCVYLCGYVVEFALKARICRVLGLSSYPDEKEVGRVFKTHNFDVLKLLAGLEEETTLAKNKALFNNWSTATEGDRSIDTCRRAHTIRKRQDKCSPVLKTDPTEY